MKILILARGVPSKEDPQEGCFEWDQVKALKSIGHTPIVMYLDARYRKVRHEWGITHSVKEDIDVYKIYGGTTTIIEHLFSFRLAVWYNNLLIEQLFKYVLRKHPDANILHAHYNRLIYAAAKINKKFNFPCVGTEHLSEVVKDRLSNKVKYVGNKGYPNVLQLITVSNFLRQVIASRFNVDSVVCGNVLGEEFINSPFINHKEGGPFTFVACGSLVPIKGFNYLIKAFASLEDLNVRLKIIGDGSKRKELQDLIHELELDQRIELVGKKTKAEIINIYTESDCFVLSSISETFGVVTIEALSQGLPVLATKCGGIDGIITEENGILVTHSDEHQLSIGLREMYAKRKAFDSDQIRKNAIDSYGPKVIANKLEYIYKTVLNKEIK